MTERAPWWRAFLPKRKTGGGPKDSTSHVFGEDFDPFAQTPKDPAASKAAGEAHPHESGKDSDDTYDDSQLESVFNEKTCRRNMKVSRSGRFKEKRRVRSTLPIEETDTGDVAAGREGMR